MLGNGRRRDRPTPLRGGRYRCAWCTGRYDEDGRVVATISAPCPAFRVDDARREEILDMVRETASAASDALSS